MKAIAATTDVDTVRWPQSSTSAQTDVPYTPTEALRDKWSSPALNTNDFMNKFSVWLAISDNTNSDVFVKPSLQPDINLKVGVPVRMARAGKLLACTGQKCDAPQTRAEGIATLDRQLAAMPADADANERDRVEKAIKKLRDQPALLAKGYEFNILQLGQFYIVPVTGGTLRSQQAVIKMDANGLPESIRVVEKVAAAAELSGAALDMSVGLAGLPAKLRAAQLEKTTSRLNQSKAEAALASAGLVNETTAVQAQLARANAQNDLATALARTDNQAETASLMSQAQLWNAKADLGAAQLRNGDTAATAGLAAHTNFLNAQDALRVAMATHSLSDQTSLLGAQTTLTNAQAAHARALTARRLAEAEAAVP